jgi:hypothetical protein
MIVLNHVDYVDASATVNLTPKAESFVRQTADAIGQRIDFVGLGPDTLLPVTSHVAVN